MFEQNDVHNCNQIDDMKNISRSCSCDLSSDEKACPRNTVLQSKGIFARLQSKCGNTFTSDNHKKQFDSNFDVYFGNTCNDGWTYYSNTAPQEKYNQAHLSRSYPRWFERTVRYLFSKQLRKCFDLA